MSGSGSLPSSSSSQNSEIVTDKTVESYEYIKQLVGLSEQILIRLKILTGEEV